MQIQSYQPEIARSHQLNLDWSNKLVTPSLQQQFQPDTWVQLLELPSTYSFDQALLLCQLTVDEWLAWIPDHGEAVLNTDQFCPLA